MQASVMDVMDLSPGDFVTLLASAAITKGVVLSVDEYFVTVQWISRPNMQGKVTTHREADLYKLAYRGSSRSLQTAGREGLSPSDQTREAHPSHGRP